MGLSWTGRDGFIGIAAASVKVEIKNDGR